MLIINGALFYISCSHSYGPCLYASSYMSFAVPTKFISEPRRSVTAYKTWDTVLKCDMFGYPSPVVRWTRSGKQLPINRHVISGNQLTILNTTEDDDGAYLCQGANQLGNVVRVIWVIVKVVGKLKSNKNNNDLWLNFHRDDSCNNIVFLFYLSP